MEETLSVELTDTLYVGETQAVLVEDADKLGVRVFERVTEPVVEADRQSEEEPDAVRLVEGDRVVVGQVVGL